MAMNYWLSLPFATTYRFIKHYPAIEELRKKIIQHAFKHNIVIIGNGEELNMENLMANRRITRKKRSLSPNRSPQPPSKRLKSASPVAPVDEQPIAQTLALVQEADAAQVQSLVHTVEQPMADAAPVPIVIALPCCTNTNVSYTPLILNGFMIEVDPVTLMVNATQICNAAGKRWYNYVQLDCAKSYKKNLESKAGITALDLIRSNRGGDHSGTMVHRLIAYHLAYWCNDDVALQFNMWVDQLLLTGRVELGNEMNAQQLDEVIKQRVKEARQEEQAKASADIIVEQDRYRDLEMRLATIQDAQQLTKAAQEELIAIKVREDLETTIQAIKNSTAPTIASYKNGDNVLYLARIDGTKFKYGQTKNLGQRLDAHTRPGVYPTFELIGIFSCANGVASEDKMRGYVKKEKIGAEYGTQREVVVLESVDALQRMMKKMHKFCMQQHASTQPANEGADVALRRIDADTSIKIKKIEAGVEIKRMDVDLEMETKKIETMRMKMIADGKITFDQYLSMNKINIC
jgi:hypothetical protein